MEIGNISAQVQQQPVAQTEELQERGGNSRQVSSPAEEAQEKAQTSQQINSQAAVNNQQQTQNVENVQRQQEAAQLNGLGRSLNVFG